MVEIQPRRCQLRESLSWRLRRISLSLSLSLSLYTHKYITPDLCTDQAIVEDKPIIGMMCSFLGGGWFVNMWYVAHNKGITKALKAWSPSKVFFMISSSTLRLLQIMRQNTLYPSSESNLILSPVLSPVQLLTTQQREEEGSSNSYLISEHHILS